MLLKSCKLCGKVFNYEGGPVKICPDCFRRIEDVYSRSHEYLRDNDDENFDVVQLSDAIGADARDVQELVEMGWLDRDLRLYKSGRMRHNLDAEILQDSPHKIFNINNDDDKKRHKQTSYGGEIYQRRPRWH